MEQLNRRQVSKTGQYYGHGKLLLSGEYFVMDGAKALALPLNLGQGLQVRYSPSFTPRLHWKSFDVNGNLWFEAHFEFWHFECLDSTPAPEVLKLQQILREVRKINKHFLRDEVDIHVETQLDFPLNWGLGSSSSLLYVVAQWAYVSPFELLFNVEGGSGYDVACAQSNRPILYQLKGAQPSWQAVDFDPPFKDQLYFIYLGRKQNSKEAIKNYRQMGPFDRSLVAEVSSLTEQMIAAETLTEFEALIEKHQELVGTTLEMPQVKQERFFDYWGEVKSLGAWGGDFALVTSHLSHEKTKDYFMRHGCHTFIPYRQLVLVGKNQLVSADLRDKKPVDYTNITSTYIAQTAVNSTNGQLLH
ncbi:MAG: GHMP kinase [Bdellovibrionales bacterium]|jgi:mevalonate kinase|nr:GHMP kinase [Bdellovibrionales bacterium]MBT3526628.1 GHMP kinase [Bdellovibrionales bacterium]MBT7766644.1 GHMP kinase [Bdellovibrionales bacterium]